MEKQVDISRYSIEVLQAVVDVFDSIPESETYPAVISKIAFAEAMRAVLEGVLANRLVDLYKFEELNDELRILFKRYQAEELYRHACKDVIRYVTDGHISAIEQAQLQLITEVMIDDFCNLVAKQIPAIQAYLYGRLPGIVDGLLVYLIIHFLVSKRHST